MRRPTTTSALPPQGPKPIEHRDAHVFLYTSHRIHTDPILLGQVHPDACTLGEFQTTQSDSI